jgi:hypothetical protein
MYSGEDYRHTPLPLLRKASKIYRQGKFAEREADMAPSFT